VIVSEPNTETDMCVSHPMQYTEQRTTPGSSLYAISSQSNPAGEFTLIITLIESKLDEGCALPVVCCVLSDYK
jgi:hypothetical protein